MKPPAMKPADYLYPGCAPQPPESERVMSGVVRPANSWAAAMDLIKPQAGLANEHPITQQRTTP